MSKSLTPQQVTEILTRDAGKKSAVQIAKENGLDPSYIRSAAQSRGISLAMPPKINDHDRFLIRELRKEGLKLEVIAAKFDCGIKLISEICKGMPRSKRFGASA